MKSMQPVRIPMDLREVVPVAGNVRHAGIETIQQGPLQLTDGVWFWRIGIVHLETLES